MQAPGAGVEVLVQLQRGGSGDPAVPENQVGHRTGREARPTGQAYVVGRSRPLGRGDQGDVGLPGVGDVRGARVEHHTEHLGARGGQRTAQVAVERAQAAVGRGPFGGDGEDDRGPLAPGDGFHRCAAVRGGHPGLGLRGRRGSFGLAARAPARSIRHPGKGAESRSRPLHRFDEVDIGLLVQRRAAVHVGKQQEVEQVVLHRDRSQLSRGTRELIGGLAPVTADDVGHGRVVQAQAAFVAALRQFERLARPFQRVFLLPSRQTQVHQGVGGDPDGIQDEGRLEAGSGSIEIACPVRFEGCDAVVVRQVGPQAPRGFQEPLLGGPGPERHAYPFGGQDSPSSAIRATAARKAAVSAREASALSGANSHRSTEWLP